MLKHVDVNMLLHTKMNHPILVSGGKYTCIHIVPTDLRFVNKNYVAAILRQKNYTNKLAEFAKKTRKYVRLHKLYGIT